MARPMQTLERILNRFTKAHGDTYDYSKVEYSRIDRPVCITCKIHGDFDQRPSNHLSGSGCPKCASTKESERRGYGLSGFVDRATQTHGDRYDYSQVEYKSVTTKIRIICRDHGEFWQLPHLHLGGAGCQECAKVKPLTTESFIERSIEIHGQKYLYDLVTYSGLNQKVQIKCARHGIFDQLACNHLAGSGCPKCSNRYRMQDAWLDHLGLPDDRFHRQVKLFMEDGSFIVADGYDATTLTVYEFWGDKWHGNPLTTNQNDIHPVCKVSYGSLYNKTLSKRDKILKSGYQIMEIWESKWKSKISSGL
jgi:hypothetical protein